MQRKGEVITSLEKSEYKDYRTIGGIAAIGVELESEGKVIWRAIGRMIVRAVERVVGEWLRR
ncbi:8130_t:CDS:2 [Paraglomus brasilianum]|uniref:8130_t:CDS:1 n=1 Tax=Paraglomus brasilianum TaxID=144538 RepID=A0A9N8ZI67_9GLOM|nr:8130_t:CDS:2 [Paraglomus brasilianum]